MMFDKASIHGSRAIPALRQSNFFKHFAKYVPVSVAALMRSYFPVALIKTADLPPSRKYIFGYHPHGIIGMGAISNFGSDATHFSKLFPGVEPHLCTLASNFKIPFYRDVLMALGICSVSRRSCQNILRKGALTSPARDFARCRSTSRDSQIIQADSSHSRSRTVSDHRRRRRDRVALRRARHQRPDAQATHGLHQARCHWCAGRGADLR